MAIAIPTRNLFIDGQWRSPLSNRRIPIINPATEQIIGSCSTFSSSSFFFFCLGDMYLSVSKMMRFVANRRHTGGGRRRCGARRRRRPPGICRGRRQLLVSRSRGLPRRFPPRYCFQGLFLFSQCSIFASACRHLCLFAVSYLRRGYSFFPFPSACCPQSRCSVLK